MRPRLLFFSVALLFLGPAASHAQGMRAVMGAARPGGAGAQASGSSVAVRMAAPASAGGLAVARPTQGIHGQVGATQVFIPSGGLPRLRTATPSIQLAPAVPASKAFPGHFFHHRAHFHHGPGVLIIEVPAFGDATLTQEFVPVGGWGSQPPVESYGFDADFGAGLSGKLAPFDPAPEEVVQRLLALAAVKKGDLVYDLGAGDGRIVIAAAKKFGARAVGFEVDPGLVKLARENVRKQGVTKSVEIRQQDFMTVDLSPANVVTLYLSRDGNLAVRSKLMRELKPGARVASYAFDMGEWQPKIAESYRDAAGENHLLYLWQIGEPLAFRARER